MSVVSSWLNVNVKIMTSRCLVEALGLAIQPQRLLDFQSGCLVGALIVGDLRLTAANAVRCISAPVDVVDFDRADVGRDVIWCHFCFFLFVLVNQCSGHSPATFLYTDSYPGI